MNELLNLDKIRELSEDYSHQRLTKDEYRRMRKELLDKIEEEINGIERDDKTSIDGGFLDKFMAYFKKTDKEEA